MKKDFNKICFVFFLIAVFSFCPSMLFADEEIEEISVVTNEKTSNLKYPLSIFVSLGPQFQYNAAPLPSAPSPILFSAGIGVKVDFLERMAFMPHLNISGTYYLLQDGNALPASPENRLAYVPELMFDFPLCYVHPVKNTYMTIGGGLAVFARFGWMASKVDDSEKANIKAINKDFWQNLSWLYPSLQFGWDFILNDETSFGVFTKLFIPLGNIGKENSYSIAQDGIMMLGFRANFSVK